MSMWSIGEWVWTGRRWFWSASVALLLLVATGFPAATAETAPHITDIAGDANGIGKQGFGCNSPGPLPPICLGDQVPLGHVSTGPASYGPADLREVRFETPYEAVPVGDDGIDYRGTGFAFHIRTEATPASDAATLVYSLRGGLNNCWSWFKVFIRGPLSPASDPSDRAVEWGQAKSPYSGDCPDGVLAHVRMTSPDVEIDPERRELTVTFHLASLPQAHRPYFEPGVVLGAGWELGAEAAGPRVFVAPLVKGTEVVGLSSLYPGQRPRIDETPTGAPFVIGSDMPEDVPCTSGCP